MCLVSLLQWRSGIQRVGGVEHADAGRLTTSSVSATRLWATARSATCFSRP